jgi:methylenetetrahydrofolate reductase (NADPH)
VLPTAKVEDAVLESVPRSVTLTVTASPAKPLDVTLSQAERLAAQGYDVVPHLAARMISGRSELTEIIARLGAAGVTKVFVPGGDADPVGDYHSSVDLLKDLAVIPHPFVHVGITGYPESHPAIHDDVTIQSMWDKRTYATHIVSNMTFDPKLVTAWVGRLRRRGVALPVLVGLPGPVETAKLVAMGTRIGVGESLRFLTKQKRTMSRLLAPGYTPERFLSVVGHSAEDPQARIGGLHLFTFNQVAQTEAWRQELLSS